MAPAIDVALLKVNAGSFTDADGGPPLGWSYPGFGLNVSYADSKCDSAESLNQAIEFYTTGQVRTVVIL